MGSSFDVMERATILGLAMSTETRDVLACRCPYPKRTKMPRDDDRV